MRVKLFPKAALAMNGKKVGYYEMMSSGIYSELTKAVVSMVPRFHACGLGIHQRMQLPVRYTQGFLSCHAR